MRDPSDDDISYLNSSARARMYDARYLPYLMRRSVVTTIDPRKASEGTFASLLPELLMLVVEMLDTHCLGNFAAACTACLEAAHGELRTALLQAVQRCLLPGAVELPVPVSNALVLCPYFCLPNVKLFSIPDAAFRGCSALKALKLPATGTLRRIGARAFEGCASLESIHLPASVTHVGVFAFNRCSSLRSLSLPARLTTIRRYTFNLCIALSTITLPTALTTIDHRGFQDCVSLESVTLPATLTRIATRAFEGCSNLTTLTLLELRGVTLATIEPLAFKGCKALQWFNLPTELTIAGDQNARPFLSRIHRRALRRRLQLHCTLQPLHSPENDRACLVPLDERRGEAPALTAPSLSTARENSLAVLTPPARPAAPTTSSHGSPSCQGWWSHDTPPRPNPNLRPHEEPPLPGSMPPDEFILILFISCLVALAISISATTGWPYT